MGRWMHLDTDDERLPDGMTRIGYDADTEQYTFRDEDGSIWESAPGCRYGRLFKVSGGPPGKDESRHRTRPSPRRRYSSGSSASEDAPIFVPPGFTYEDLSHGPGFGPGFGTGFGRDELDIPEDAKEFLFGPAKRKPPTTARISSHDDDDDDEIPSPGTSVLTSLEEFERELARRESQKSLFAAAKTNAKVLLREKEDLRSVNGEKQRIRPLPPESTTALSRETTRPQPQTHPPAPPSPSSQSSSFLSLQKDEQYSTRPERVEGGDARSTDDRYKEAASCLGQARREARRRQREKMLDRSASVASVKWNSFKDRAKDTLGTLHTEADVRGRQLHRRATVWYAGRSGKKEDGDEGRVRSSSK